MSFVESVKMGLKGLAVHKVRAGLSMLGIVFGVASVVAVVSVADGGRREVERFLEALGSTNIRVKARTFEDDHEKRVAARKRSDGLKVAEARYLGEAYPVFVAWAPVKHVRAYKQTVNVRRGTEVLSTPAVVGTTPAYLDVMGYSLREGRFLSDEDESGVRRVCVVEELIRRQLWPSGSAVGGTLYIDNEPYEVVGELELKFTGEEKFELAAEPRKHPAEGEAREAGKREGEDDASSQGQSDIERRFKDLVAEERLNRRIYIPLSCALARTTQSLRAAEIDEAIFKVASLDDLVVAKDILVRHLTSAHGMSDVAPDARDFRVEVPMDLIRQTQTNQRIFNWVIGATAGISLLVGGIGIMNIMLANVTERRREIGIRRAVGATEADVLRQFTLEAVGICVFGGVVGVFVGWGMSKAVSLFAGYTTSVALWGVVVALFVSVADGLAFGIYPAYKAAKLDPIEALRSE
ncbi:MAG: ABC transporter permease [Planctomycetota bacterium]|jgi:putative ABC transport system permease protein